MPYKLQKARGRDLYWVVTKSTGARHSIQPIEKSKAEAQMRVLNLVGGGPRPDKSILQAAAQQAYRMPTHEQIGSYKLVEQTPTLRFYVDDAAKTVVVGIRGTQKTDINDLAADVSLALGNLEQSTRFKNDLAALKSFQARYPPSEWDYYGSGHSLGGAILDSFLDLHLLKSGLSYNAAVQPQHLRDASLPIDRIYAENDPLYALAKPFLAREPEVRAAKRDLPKNIPTRLPFVSNLVDSMQGHRLSQFEGGAHDSDSDSDVGGSRASGLIKTLIGHKRLNAALLGPKSQHLKQMAHDHDVERKATRRRLKEHYAKTFEEYDAPLATVKPHKATAIRFAPDVKRGRGTAPIFATKAYPENYSDDALVILNAMSFDTGLKLLGSMSLRSQPFAGDYDAYEVVEKKGHVETAVHQLRKRFQQMVRHIKSMRNVYIGDIKAGSVEAWRVLPKSVRVVDGRVVGWDFKRAMAHVADLLAHKIISKEEADKAVATFKDGDAFKPADYFSARDVCKFHVLRWSTKNVLANSLTLRDGSKITLETAFQCPTIAKMDVIAMVQGARYTDFSAIYEFKVDGKTINPDPIDIQVSLKADIAYYTAKGKYFKALKRRFALAKVNNDVRAATAMQPILNSDLGRLYYLVGDIGTLTNLLKHPRVPIADVRFEIDQFKTRLSNVYQLPALLAAEPGIDAEIDRVLSLGRHEMIEPLDKLEERLDGILQDGTLAMMRKGKMRGGDGIENATNGIKVANDVVSGTKNAIKTAQTVGSIAAEVAPGAVSALTAAVPGLAALGPGLTAVSGALGPAALALQAAQAGVNIAKAVKNASKAYDTEGADQAAAHLGGYADMTLKDFTPAKSGFSYQKIADNRRSDPMQALQDCLYHLRAFMRDQTVHLSPEDFFKNVGYATSVDADEIRKNQGARVGQVFKNLPPAFLRNQYDYIRAHSIIRMEDMPFGDKFQGFSEEFVIRLAKLFWHKFFPKFARPPVQVLLTKSREFLQKAPNGNSWNVKVLSPEEFKRNAEAARAAHAPGAGPVAPTAPSGPDWYYNDTAAEKKETDDAFSARNIRNRATAAFDSIARTGRVGAGNGPSSTADLEFQQDTFNDFLLSIIQYYMTRFNRELPDDDRTPRTIFTFIERLMDQKIQLFHPSHAAALVDAFDEELREYLGLDKVHNFSWKAHLKAVRSGKEGDTAFESESADEDDDIVGHGHGPSRIATPHHAVAYSPAHAHFNMRLAEELDLAVKEYMHLHRGHAPPEEMAGQAHNIFIKARTNFNRDYDAFSQLITKVQKIRDTFNLPHLRVWMPPPPGVIDVLNPLLHRDRAHGYLTWE